MVFASFVFLFWFVPLFLPLYFAAPQRWRNIVLTLGSFAFYGWWRPQYVLLMLVSVVIDHVAARGMGERGDGPAGRGRRRLWLLLSVVANLGLLGWFKYANLLVATWNDVVPWPVEWERVLLPIGISFFTFQSMSYTIDVYRGDVKPTRCASCRCSRSWWPARSCATGTSSTRCTAVRPISSWPATACCASRSASPRRC